mgnify:CR=1 FL=1
MRPLILSGESCRPRMSNSQWEAVRNREERIEKWAPLVLGALLLGNVAVFVALARGWIGPG